MLVDVMETVVVHSFARQVPTEAGSCMVPSVGDLDVVMLVQGTPSLLELPS